PGSVTRRAGKPVGRNTDRWETGEIMTSRPTPDTDSDVSERDVLRGRASALSEDGIDDAGFLDDAEDSVDGEQLERAERAAFRRVQGLYTVLADITGVAYRQLRLERVALASVWSDGTAGDAENSLREIAALAETAGALVLEGVIHRRVTP